MPPDLRFRVHPLFSRLVAMGALLLAARAGRAEFVERALALPQNAERGGGAYCDAWTAKKTGGAPPVMMSHFFADTQGGQAFAFWALGPRLLQAASPLPPSTILAPDSERLGSGVIRYAFARLKAGAAPSFLFATETGIVAYVPAADGKVLETSRPVKLIDATFPSSELDQLGRRVMPTVFSLDLDGDGKDELVIPDQDGWAAYGGEGASYGRRIGLPVPFSDVEFGFEVDSPALPGGKGLAPRRSIDFSRSDGASLRFRDLNGDGRLDILAVRRDAATSATNSLRMEVYRQLENGEFSKQPAQVIRYERKDLRRDWRDLNGDGLLDPVELQANNDLVAPLMTIDMFLARGSESDFRGVEPWQRFRARNPSGLALFGDWDGDGDMDFARTYFDYTFGSASDMAEMLFGEELKVRLMLYPFEKKGGGSVGPADSAGAPAGGAYSRFPAISREFEIKTECLYSYPGELLVKIVDDLTGDGKPDLVLRTRPDLLSVYALDLAGKSLSRKPALEFSIPERTVYHVADLDANGKADLWWFDPDKMAVVCRLQK